MFSVVLKLFWGSFHHEFIHINRGLGSLGQRGKRVEKLISDAGLYTRGAG